MKFVFILLNILLVFGIEHVQADELRSMTFSMINQVSGSNNTCPTGSNASSADPYLALLVAECAKSEGYTISSLNDIPTIVGDCNAASKILSCTVSKCQWNHTECLQFVQIENVIYKAASFDCTLTDAGVCASTALSASIFALFVAFLMWSM